MTTVLFAIQSEREQQVFRTVLQEQSLEMNVIVPDTVSEIDDYIHRLVQHLFEVYNVDSSRISVTFALEPIPVTIRQAVPVALLLNELVSNSLKYAYPGELSGEITIGVHRDEHDRVHLCVTDNGVGLKPGFRIASAETLGHALISGLASQLDGSLDIRSENGTAITVTFPLEIPDRSGTSRET